MPRKKNLWFRFYVEATHDTKLRCLSPTHRWLWVSILSAARESPISGYLMVSESLAMSEPMLSDYAAVRLQDVKSGIKTMDSLGLIIWDSNLGCWMVPRWSDRQYESDDVTSRTAKHRSKEQGRNVPTSALGTPPETEAEAETYRSTGDTDSLQRPSVSSEPPSNIHSMEAVNKWMAETYVGDAS